MCNRSVLGSNPSSRAKENAAPSGGAFSFVWMRVQSQFRAKQNPPDKSDGFCYTLSMNKGTAKNIVRILLVVLTILAIWSFIDPTSIVNFVYGKKIVCIQIKEQESLARRSCYQTSEDKTFPVSSEFYNSIRNHEIAPDIIATRIMWMLKIGFTGSVILLLGVIEPKSSFKPKP